METYALGLIIKLGLSVVAVLAIGIIVTSSMIPETFRAVTAPPVKQAYLATAAVLILFLPAAPCFMLANITRLSDRADRTSLLACDGHLEHWALAYSTADVRFLLLLQRLARSG